MIDPTAAQAVAQQPQNWMQLVYMTIIVIVVNVPLWIREFQKHKDWKAKNGTLNEIKKSADAANKAAQEVKKSQISLSRDMVAQVKVCKSISGPLAKQVQENSKNIIDILKA